MNCKLLLSGLVCAALLSGCRLLFPSSEPSGQWQDVNQRASFVTYQGGEHAEPQR